MLNGCSPYSEQEKKAEQALEVTETGKRPNILFVISDDQSHIHTSYAGDPAVKTPAFDQLANNGVYFKNAFTNVASCAPSRASILTGQSFWRLGEAGLLFGRFKKQYPIFTRLLAEHGYAVGVTGKHYAPARQDFPSTYPFVKAGEGLFDEKIDIEIEVPKGIIPEDYAGSFTQFMDKKPKGQPFFFWLGSYEPHRDYDYGIGARNGIDPNKVHVPAFLPDNEIIRNDIADYLYEIQWMDSHLQRALDYLAANGELDNTLIVYTSDNGMPFPRAKATVMNYGVQMPLAIMWKGKVMAGREIDDFVNHADFAPTFLEAAGIDVPTQMSGKSLLNILLSKESGQIEPERTSLVTGIERHVWSRPGGTTYGRRAMHTADWVYIRNYNPERWPMGTPGFEASHQGLFGDVDAGPTKTFMLEHQNDPAIKPLFDLSFGRLPADELYDMKNDPEQMINLAGEQQYAEVMKALQQQLDEKLTLENDPRSRGEDPWQDYPFYFGEQYLKGKYLSEVQALSQ